ncbi:MAG: DUF389 domain-containing protein [Gemmatimonadota bacterium]|nr:DUF389 domain-containing protein [Gemmatimonadota bacterium]
MTRKIIDPANERQRLHPRIERMQHLIATALGVDEQRRLQSVEQMLENNARRVPGYWIQLFLATGIATLGLTLDSTAVVIGAMLVSPLMGPIIELGMGFAVGSSLLVIQASMRTFISIVVVVATASLLVLALPFHEITREVAARASPTALDLLVAVFCALTAGYTTVRPGSDTTAAAAGTAIGIALIPPLCAAGFGIGTADRSIAGGAALLFIANLSAILVVASVSFLLLGFNQVSAATVEAEFLGTAQGRSRNLAGRAHSALSGLFGSRHGLAMRILIPALFLVAVYVPLRHALDEVSWEVRTRAAVNSIVAEESPSAIQTSLVLQQHTVSLKLFAIGTDSSAADLEQRISSRIAKAAGLTPAVSVIAVPDAQMLKSTAAAQRAGTGEAAAPITSSKQRIADALNDDWPPAAGALLQWELTMASADSSSLAVHHIGPPLLAIGEGLLERTLSARVRSNIRIQDFPLPPDTIRARRSSLHRWADSARARMGLAASTERAIVCIEGPIAAKRRRNTLDRSLASEFRTSKAAKASKLFVTDGPAWEIRIAAGSCESQPPAATQATQ